ncbi:LEA type 2 family protein [Desulfobulbus rhabdoformis]|uniref:LEA type 2 family protein n=1 Tax=Desulfobulbus rhabdoformis TaxID=34032 RepID=UPI0019630A5C|nr:LEA type 2 family protein [Desulfobulbus rhabdoformis]MBM9615957.1 LEA type 2 family protein [Desulfobulbus rhabdoformis]
MFFNGLQSKCLSFFVLILAIFCLTGCSGLYGLKEDPKISLADIRIQEVKALEGIFLIKLRILNPNDVAIDLRGVNCDLEINKRHFASGVGDSSQTVPAYGTAIIPVEVYASVLDLISSVSDLMHSAGKLPSKDHPLPYTLRGFVRVGLHGFSKEIPFTSTGELSLKGLNKS